MTPERGPKSEFRWPVRVYYEDTDAGGVVYYANYLRFMERARTEWLRELGFEQDRLRERLGVLFAVRRAAIDYLSPARFNELLEIRSELIGRGGVSLDFRQQVVRTTDDVVCCGGEIKIVCVAAETLRPTRIPKAIVVELDR